MADGRTVAVLVAAYAAAGAACQVATPGARPGAAVAVTGMVSLLGPALWRARGRTAVAAAAVALAGLYAWRRAVDPAAVVGPVPPSLEVAALAVLGLINAAAAGAAALVFATGSRVYRARWAVVGAAAAALLAFGAAAARRAEQARGPGGLLRRVAVLEASADRNDWAARQELSTALAILGRPREARAVPLTPGAAGQALIDPHGPPPAVTPWREAVARIAAERRLVVVMEAHTVSEHRAWVGQALGLFREAGFTHYYAEAITEPAGSLRARGYPTSATGFYTLDPRFGNLIRSALRGGFEVGGYDPGGAGFDAREQGQAAVLAGRFTSKPGVKMLVHAGHGHVFKHEVRHVGRYMAARLWALTGVEPYTVWQVSDAPPNPAYADLIRRIGPVREPVVLAPPPPDVAAALFPESTVQPAVDALVVHPPHPGREPADRSGGMPGDSARVRGDWRGSRWPVVLAAVAAGEPDDAVPLDHVMLRPGETAFEWWLPPSSTYHVRAWTLDGPLTVRADTRSPPVRVDARD